MKTTTRCTRSRTRRRLPVRAPDDIVTSAVLPRRLHRRVRVAAVTLNWTLGEVVRVALSEWLDRNMPHTRRSA